jgi:hypothetical protein
MEGSQGLAPGLDEGVDVCWAPQGGEGQKDNLCFRDLSRSVRTYMQASHTGVISCLCPGCVLSDDWRRALLETVQEKSERARPVPQVQQPLEQEKAVRPAVRLTCWRHYIEWYRTMYVV